MDSIWLLLVLCTVHHSSCNLLKREFLPFGADAGDILLPRNDDGSSDPISLPLPFPFFDTLHSTAYVNNNGDISFDGPVPIYTPQEFPLDNFPLIAPFWADVDTRGTGEVWYRNTTHETLKDSVKELIKYSFVDQSRFEPAYNFIATWDQVGYYSHGTTKTNTFQCVMTTDGTVAFVIFIYAENGIQWTTGDASGGTDGLGGIPAHVGFNAGDGIRFESIPGSRTNEILNITITSNIGIDGVWVFRVDEEEIPMGELTISPQFGNMLGGSAVKLSIFQFTLKHSDNIACNFDEIFVTGVYMAPTYTLCISPQFASPRTVNLQLTVTRNEQVEYQGVQKFYVLSTDRAHAVDFLNSTTSYLSAGLRIEPSQSYKLVWNNNMLLPEENPSSYSVCISWYLLDSQWLPAIAIGNHCEVENKGHFESTLGFGTCIDICPVIVSVKVDLTSSTSLSQKFSEMQQSIALWSGIFYYTVLTDTSLKNFCDVWDESEKLSGDELQLRLRSCPRMLLQAKAPNSGFTEQKMTSVIGSTSYASQWMNYFHSFADVCFVQSTYRSSDGGSRQQCCYKDGNLYVEAGGGTADRYAPLDSESIVLHITKDLVPYIYCCTIPSKCDIYTTHRPYDTVAIYNPNAPACLYGDPHIVTLDGLKYTFNGKGEYILIATDGDMFSLQGRMVEVEISSGGNASASVFSALVAQQTYSDTVQFELSRRGIDVCVNGEILVFSDLDEIPFNNVTVSDRGNSSYSALFNSGAYVEVRLENDIISTVLVSLPDSFEGITRGLMGSYNRDIYDDLLPNGSRQPISINSSLEEIHKQFGVTWIINRAENSLFTYKTGESLETFNDMNFLPAFEIEFSDPFMEEIAIQICGNNQFCLFDIAATNSTRIGLTTLMGSEEYDTIVALSSPIMCNPPCVNGVCVSNDTCTCTDGYIGPTCSEPIVSECDVNPCENEGSCSLIGRSYICHCYDGFYGSFCQNSPPIDCMCIRNMECSISGNFVGQDLLKVIPNGKQLKCLAAFDKDKIEVDKLHVDESFHTSQQFLLAGSLAFLENVGIAQTRDDFTTCSLLENIVERLPIGSPSATLKEFGVETLYLQYMDNVGTFDSIQLSRTELDQIVRKENYTLDGLLCEENACSLQHLLYWLATVNSYASSGSGNSERFLSSTSEDITYGLDSGSGGQSTDPLPVSITNTLCKQRFGDSGSTSIVFPINC